MVEEEEIRNEDEEKGSRCMRCGGCRLLRL
jgi:hypothetical protein